MKRMFVPFLAVLLLLTSLSVPLAESAPEYTFSSDSYVLGGGIVDKSSPTLADLSGDGRPEILLGTTGYNALLNNHSSPMVLEARRGDGSIWFRQSIPAPMNSSPAVGDIDNDGDPEVVVSVGGDVADTDHYGGVHAYSNAGSHLWFFDTQDIDSNGYSDGVYSSPTLCDVDGDQDLEIIFGAWDQRIYMLDHNGNSIWNNKPAGYTGEGFLVGDSVWSTAACVDLNRDGNKEIIIGGDITGGGVLPDGTHTEDGGYLFIFDKDGNILVRRYLDEAVYAAPAVGDLDGDGDYEIVSGTSWYWWNAHGRTDQPYVYAFETGNVFNGQMDYFDPSKLPHLSGWPCPTDYPGFSSPALADLDGDGDLEVVIGTSHPDLQNDAIAGDGSVYAWHHTGQLVSGWPVRPTNWDNQDGPIFSSPTVSDVDGDGDLEVLFSMLWDVYVYNAGGSRQHRLETAYNVWGSPAVGDTDQDGRPDIWIGGGNVSGDQTRGYLWHWELTDQVEIDTPWPMFHRTPQNTRYYVRPPQLRVSLDSLVVMHEQGSSSTVSRMIRVVNGGSGTIDWTAEALHSDVSVTPSSGTVDVNGQTLEFVLSVGSYSLGTHELGSADFSALAGGETVRGSPFSVPITVHVVEQVYNTYLPLASKH
jgi:hypothetical protein